MEKVEVGVAYKVEEGDDDGNADVGEPPKDSLEDRVERELRRAGKAALAEVEEIAVVLSTFIALLCASVVPVTRSGRLGEGTDIGNVDAPDALDMETGLVIWREGEAKPNPALLDWREGEVRIDRGEGDESG